MFEKEKAAHEAGKRIEVRVSGRMKAVINNYRWTLTPNPIWLSDCEYRIHPDDVDKPTKKQAFIVFVSGMNTPRVVHNTEASALKEAERLSRLEKNRNVYVCEIQYTICTSVTTTTEIIHHG